MTPGSNVDDIHRSSSHLLGAHEQAIAPHSDQDFIGRVPVVLSFVGLPDESTDRLIRELDASLYRFSQQRVQLMAVTGSDPQEWADRLGVNVTILQDPDLATQLDASRRPRTYCECDH